LWQDGQERLLLENPSAFQLLPEATQRQFDPSGRNLVIYEETTRNELGIGILPYAINLQSCLSGNCELQDYNGFPYWSPDLSKRLIFVPGLDPLLFLQNDQTGEEIPLEFGFNPLWIDENSFIYIRFGDESESSVVPGSHPEIVLATVDDPLTPTVLLNWADIATLTDDDDPTVPVSIQSVIAHPDQPNWLFIAAGLHPDTESQNNYILSFRRDTGDIALLSNLNDNALVGPLQILANGQSLIFQSFGQPPDTLFNSQLLSLIPLEPATMSAGSPININTPSFSMGHDWSQDGRWLLFIMDNALRLTAPGQAYDQIIPHNFDSCSEAAWINAPAAEE
jgi:hypothetical protein